MTVFRKKRRVHPLFLLLIILAVLCSGFFLMEFILRNTFVALAESQAQWRATEAIHEAILEEIGEETAYRDLIHFEKDNNNRIIYMQANIIKINRITSSVTMNIQRRFEDLKNKEFDIPLGQVTESMLLATFGPNIKFRLLPVGTISVVPEDSFEHAGINQTRHKIYLKVKSSVKVVIPFISSVVDVNMNVPVADAVIVGEVPDTYVEFSGQMGEGLFSSSLGKR